MSPAFTRSRALSGAMVFLGTADMAENDQRLGRSAVLGLLIGLFHAVCGLLLLWTIPTRFVSFQIARSDTSTGGAWVAVFALGLIPFLVAMALLGVGVGFVQNRLPSRVLGGVASALIFGLCLILMAFGARVLPDTIFSIATGIPLMFGAPLPIGLTALVAALAFASTGARRP
jgi:hypothetical protein